MKPIVKILKELNCSIAIIDLTLDSDEYLNEHIEDTEAYHQRNKYKYSETVTINIIIKNTTKESTIIKYTVTDHCSYLDEEHFNFNEDGYYTIIHAIIPTIEYANVNSPLIQYVWDGEIIHKRTSLKDCEISMEEFAEIVTNLELDNTTISGVTLTLFSICHLYLCFINKCQESFKNISPCSTNTYNNRDLVWMTINIIKYYVELGLLLLAQRLLELLNSCGELCSESMFLKSDCGCFKRA